MRTVRTLTAAALTLVGALCAVAAAPAVATGTPSTGASPSASGKPSGPTEAGTGFRTATALQPGERATADASTGDYLYWVLPLDAGSRTTVRATVSLPATATRHAASTWQLDVYDGLRRRQPCTYGAQTRAVAKDAPSVGLSCTLRTVRAGAEPWSDDPLPGSYYVRLTVVGLAQEDVGLPVRAEVEAASQDTGGALAVDGALSAPLVPGIGAARADAASPAQQPAATGGEPADGWSGGWWSDRWLWTAGGGVLAALAAIGGYRLTRGAGRPSRVAPHA
ncbi:hypothetical protein [Streptomyces sp. G-G2]|uniref:hypothetical protein n=1 Tax=Streptomyces sp. G-G2 TaxID=3046201 RepID=UPI0024BAB7C6|nr:hypothetical protein [Streptomyces sp. G-G2]MDJ0382035.1 hypothetical protein [Streptomyces sp. G-G2]